MGPAERAAGARGGPRARWWGCGVPARAYGAGAHAERAGQCERMLLRAEDEEIICTSVGGHLDLDREDLVGRHERGKRESSSGERGLADWLLTSFPPARSPSQHRAIVGR